MIYAAAALNVNAVVGTRVWGRAQRRPVETHPLALALPAANPACVCGSSMSAKRSQWREGLQNLSRGHGFSTKVLLDCCLVRRLVAWATPNAKGRSA